MSIPELEKVPGAAWTTDPVTLRAVAVDPVAMTAAAERLVIEAAADFASPHAAKIASRAALLFAIAGHLERAHALLDAAVATLRNEGESRPLAIAGIRMAQVHQLAGRGRESLEILDRIVLDCRAAPTLHDLLDFALQHRGKVLFEAGSFAEAIDCVRECLALRIAKADPGLIASTRLAIAVVECQCS